MAISWGDVKPTSPEGWKRAARLSSLALVLASASAGNETETAGNVRFDSTIGSNPGPAPHNETYHWVIDASRGEIRNHNLFFSFSDFFSETPTR